MKLKKMILKNFRAYQEAFEINFDDFTAIIGRNDIGKSSLFEALDIFFNDGAKGCTKIDKSDLSIDADSKNIEISCIFSDFPEELVLDAEYPTNLKKEFLLNKNGYLEIVKKYDVEKYSIKAETSIKAFHPVSPTEISNLMKLKQSDLKSQIDKLGITENVNKSINSSMREALRNHFNGSTEYAETLLEIDKEDGKRIMDKLKEELPHFALFKSDRTNSDKESEVQDPISLATKKAIEKELEKLKEIQISIQKQVEEVSERTIAELKKINEGLASKLKLNLESPKWDNLFKFSLDDENQIPINKRGSGIRRLILLSFFKAEVEHKRQNGEKERPVIYAIEEPETSQHPNFQQMILESLNDISALEGNQVFITTHSPSFMNYLDIENIRYLFNNTSNVVKICDGNDDCISILYDSIFKDLGIMRNDKVKLIILIEGFSDEDYIKHFSKIYSAKYPEINDLNNRDDIAFLPFGGGNLKHWAERKYLDNFYPHETYKFCIVDGDEGRYVTFSDKILENHDGETFKLNKETIENYVAPTAIVKQANYEGLSIDALVVDANNPKISKLLAKLHYEHNTSPGSWELLPDDKKKKKVQEAKNNIREKILSTITVADVEGIDEGEIKALLTKISLKLQ